MPDLDTDEIAFDALPDQVVASVLDRFGYTEPMADTTVEPEQPGEEPEEESEEEEAPSPPGGPIFTPEEEGDETGPDDDTAAAPPAPTETAPADPLAQLLSERLGDERFRDGLLQLLLGQGQPVPTQPAPDFQLPQISEDDLDNPAVRASLLILNQQREQIAELQTQFAETRRVAEERNAQELSRVAETAVQAFKSAYNLPDHLIHKIRVAAGPMTMAASQATGSQDPYTVMSKALELAYWNEPEARKFEFERQTDARSKAAARKQKLGGVGGNSGSAPRNPEPIDTSTREGRFDAAVQEVTAAMFGTDEQ